MRYSILFKNHGADAGYTLGDETYATIDDAVKTAIACRDCYAGFKVIQVIEWRAFDDNADTQ